MTHSPEVGQYRLGDIALVRCDEPDPFDGWPAYAEHMCHDMRSIRINGELVGVVGYFLIGPRQASSFALIDRSACAGHGIQLSTAVRSRVVQWMDEAWLTHAYADCSSDDRAAKVFLRAIGYRRIAGEDPARTEFLFTRGFKDEQGS